MNNYGQTLRSMEMMEDGSAAEMVEDPGSLMTMDDEVFQLSMVFFLLLLLCIKRRKRPLVEEINTQSMADMTTFVL